MNYIYDTEIDANTNLTINCNTTIYNESHPCAVQHNENNDNLENFFFKPYVIGYGSLATMLLCGMGCLFFKISFPNKVRPSRSPEQTYSIV